MQAQDVIRKGTNYQLNHQAHDQAMNDEASRKNYSLKFTKQVCTCTRNQLKHYYLISAFVSIGGPGRESRKNRLSHLINIYFAFMLF